MKIFRNWQKFLKPFPIGDGMLLANAQNSPQAPTLPEIQCIEVGDYVEIALMNATGSREHCIAFVVDVKTERRWRTFSVVIAQDLELWPVYTEQPLWHIPGECVYAWRFSLEELDDDAALSRCLKMLIQLRRHPKLRMHPASEHDLARADAIMDRIKTVNLLESCWQTES